MELLSKNNIGFLIKSLHPKIAPSIKKHYEVIRNHIKTTTGNEADNIELRLIDYIIKLNCNLNEHDLKNFFDECQLPQNTVEKYMTTYHSIMNLNEALIDDHVTVFKSVLAKIYSEKIDSEELDPVKKIEKLKTIDLSVGIEESIRKNTSGCTLSSLDLTKIRDELGKPIKSRYEFINKSSPIGGYIRNQLITIAAGPAVGKSQYAMDEFEKQLLDGEDVCYIAIGDIVTLDIASRMMAKHYNISINSAMLELSMDKDNKRFIEMTNNLHGNHGYILFVKPNALTIDELLKVLESEGLIQNYKNFIFDYDNNIKGDVNLFMKFDEIYQKLSYLSRIPGKTVFALSQLQRQAWSKLKIEEDDLGESRRKAEISDMVVTISRDQSSYRNKVGMLNIAKARRCVPMASYYFLDISGKIYEINETTYLKFKNTKYHYTNVTQGFDDDEIEYRLLNAPSESIYQSDFNVDYSVGSIDELNINENLESKAKNDSSELLDILEKSKNEEDVANKHKDEVEENNKNELLTALEENSKIEPKVDETPVINDNSDLLAYLAG